MPKRLLIAATGILTLNLAVITPALANGKSMEHGKGGGNQAAAKTEKPQQHNKSRHSKAQSAAKGPSAASKHGSASSAPAKTAKSSSQSKTMSTSTAVQTSSHNPPGNNGTVKIDAEPFDTHPNNQPHVGCRFQVDFYNFDHGDLHADVIFTGHAPTGGGTLLTDRVFIGEDAAGGGRDLDNEVTYNLTSALNGITPHPKQGYHVKLTVHAGGSIGADTKHKVFWVQSCAAPGKGGGFTPTTSKFNGGMGGGLLSRAAAPTVQAVGGQLPNTGSMLDLLLAAILALGFAGTVRARELWREHWRSR